MASPAGSAPARASASRRSWAIMSSCSTITAVVPVTTWAITRTDFLGSLGAPAARSIGRARAGRDRESPSRRLRRRVAATEGRRTLVRRSASDRPLGRPAHASGLRPRCSSLPAIARELAGDRTRPRSASSATWSTCPAICSARRWAAMCCARTSGVRPAPSAERNEILGYEWHGAPRALLPRRVGRRVDHDLTDDPPASMVRVTAAHEKPGERFRDPAAPGSDPWPSRWRNAAPTLRPASTALAS